jgi:hypothetical protein
MQLGDNDNDINGSEPQMGVAAVQEPSGGVEADQETRRPTDDH